MRAVQRSEYIARLVVLMSQRTASQELTASAKAGQAEYLQRLQHLVGTLGAPLAGVELDTALQGFRCEVMRRSEELRWRLMGSTVVRRRTLPAALQRCLVVLEQEGDLLSPMRAARTESVHSSLLGHFLDTAEDSPLAQVAAAEFLRLVGASTGSNSELKDPPVSLMARTEVWLPMDPGSRSRRANRIDVCLSRPGLLVFVEVKVDAGEGEDQLPRYGAALEEQVSASDARGVLVYLTADAEQTPSTDCVHISMRDLLAAWLPVAAVGTSWEHLYLGAYLRTLARALCRLTGRGPFDTWTLRQRRATLDFLEKELGHGPDRRGV